ncbi:MAG: hypothetical protein A3A58_02670 [Candidatus Blackburnbacteria bacterium RIFCSPLOWO2_01_FULL_41_27]|uniref:Uncharacterized protein n=2 Tax=Candidatus Blackburniibacteriota TaxID=1817898 RepID=A0A1G1V6E3_9BACT|nr:MAG: hypothetical protein A3F61_02670 [Candidatus Blackburnbacteria bacterium RIFCSPHIGHO2_12_FULL_41_13b]OGY13097.1 MAG: hypothetical protein A3A58_02670 [Candidatus Blackburnbacteria bacterium RIFCSPLOWO2_01_FULL_41_27]
MAQVSKYPIQKDVADKIFLLLAKSISKTKTDSQAVEFMESLFTPTERIMLAKRVAIAYLLAKDYQYRDIQKVLRVSMPTIAFVSSVMKYGNDSYRKIVKSIQGEEKLETLFDEVIKGILKPLGEVSKGGNTYRYLKMEIEKEQNKKNAF